MFAGASSKLSKNELKIHHLRDQIHKAAIEFDVSPEIVGAIILDELERRSLEDDIEEILSALWPGLVYFADWSIGIAQIKPKTAERVYTEIIGECPTPTKIVTSLLDEGISCRIVAGYLRYIINLWKEVYPAAEDTHINGNGAKLMGTLYSMEVSGNRGVNSHPRFNPRAEGIVASMPRIHDLIATSLL